MKVLVALCIFAALAAAVHADTPSKPTFLPQYEVAMSMALPYADIDEPINFWYDEKGGRSRMETYGGVDTTITLVGSNTSYLLSPHDGVPSCFKIYDENTVIQSMFPDMTNFAYNGTTQVLGMDVYAWQYVHTEGAKTNTYTFYDTVADRTPVRYTLMGYDTLLGSHFDEYIVTYYNVIGGVNEDAFQVPDMTCPWMPGSSGPSREGTAWSANPLHDMKDLFPNSRLNEQGNKVRNELFEKWADQHGKVFDSERHRAYRRGVFHRNHRMINSHNRAHKSWTMKLNHLADMTRSERNSVMNGARFDLVAPGGSNGASHYHVPESKTVEDLPSDWDWREHGGTTAVKDQGVCGSCWSFGAHQTIESALFLKTGVMTRLSSQELVDCSWYTGNNGCQGGLDFLGYQYIMESGGLATEDNYPYTMANMYCQNKTAGHFVQISGYVNVTSGDEHALLDAVVSKGAISVSIDASLDTFSFYGSGVYNDQNCKNKVSELDHTVLLVGYGTEAGQDYWLIKNSWSTHYGNGGYVNIARANNLCGVATQPTYTEIADN